MIKRSTKKSFFQEPVPLAPAPPFRVTRRVLTATCRHARSAAPNECIGLLASHKHDRSGIVTHVFRLRAEASLTRAVADPQGIAKVVAQSREQEMSCRGFYHSHVKLSAHHSSIDDSTMTRLLPGMAEDNFVRPGFSHRAPTVTAPDEAMLPLVDGTSRTFTLSGPPIPGLNAYEKAQWTSVSTLFRDRKVQPKAIQEDDRLFLCSGPIVLALGLPPGATVSSRIVDASPLRVATMFSLVVNIRGEIYCEALTVHDVNGRSFIEMGPCAVDVVDEPEAKGRSIGNGHIEASVSGRER